jgi:predicted HD phosphohydrolase
MARDRSLVRNAADQQQVRWANRKVDRREEVFQSALRAVMATPAGRLVLAELLERAGLYVSSYAHSGSEMCFREGRRSFGLELLADLTRASESDYEQLERERRQRARGDEREAEAIRTRTLTGGEDTNG